MINHCVVFQFRTTFHGLRSDTEYVIKISFMMSGRKLGSEAYTILSHDNPARKSSSTSTIAPLGASKDSLLNVMTPKHSNDMVTSNVPLDYHL